MLSTQVSAKERKGWNLLSYENAVNVQDQLQAIYRTALKQLRGWGRHTWWWPVTNVSKGSMETKRPAKFKPGMHSERQQRKRSAQNITISYVSRFTFSSTLYIYVSLKLPHALWLKLIEHYSWKWHMLARKTILVLISKQRQQKRRVFIVDFIFLTFLVKK